jgi:hypothetical protein
LKYERASTARLWARTETAKYKSQDRVALVFGFFSVRAASPAHVDAWRQNAF